MKLKTFKMVPKPKPKLRLGIASEDGYVRKPKIQSSKVESFLGLVEGCGASSLPDLVSASPEVVLTLVASPEVVLNPMASSEMVLPPTSASVDVHQVGLGMTYLGEAGGSIMRATASTNVAKFLPEVA